MIFITCITDKRLIYHVKEIFINVGDKNKPKLKHNKTKNSNRYK